MAQARVPPTFTVAVRPPSLPAPRPARWPGRLADAGGSQAPVRPHRGDEHPGLQPLLRRLLRARRPGGGERPGHPRFLHHGGPGPLPPGAAHDGQLGRPRRRPDGAGGGAQVGAAANAGGRRRLRLRLPTRAVSLRAPDGRPDLRHPDGARAPLGALPRWWEALTRLPAPAALHQAAMRAFARSYGVDLAEAELPIEGYARFSDFFSRALKPGARAVDPDPRAVVSPVDGAVSEAGRVEAGSCLQAKGIHYPVDRLLGDAELARAFADGGSLRHALPLAPRLPPGPRAGLGPGGRPRATCAGSSGRSIQPRCGPRTALFCANERLVTLLETDLGRCAVVKVGATCVGRIRSAYDDRLTHAGQTEGVRTFDPRFRWPRARSWGASRWAPRSSSSSSLAGYAGRAGSRRGPRSGWDSASEAPGEPEDRRGEGDERPPRPRHRGVARAGGGGAAHLRALRLRGSPHSGAGGHRALRPQRRGRRPTSSGKEMYTFEDKAGRSLSLRPEGTAPLVRAYIEHAVAQQEPLTRWWYLGPMFRYERMKTGRYRQFWQVGAEAYGAAGPAQEAELIDLALQLFRSVGLGAIRLEINSLGDADTRPRYLETLQAFLRAPAQRAVRRVPGAHREEPPSRLRLQEPRMSGRAEGGAGDHRFPRRRGQGALPCPPAKAGRAGHPLHGESPDGARPRLLHPHRLRVPLRRPGAGHGLRGGRWRALRRPGEGAGRSGHPGGGLGTGSWTGCAC